MPLQAHPFHAPVERPKVIAHGQASLAGFFPVPDGDVQHEILFPAQEGVAHQAGNVIGDGTINRVLKVQHAQLRLARRDHQVPGHEIAVHIHGRPNLALFDDHLERVVQCAPHGVIDHHAAVPVQIPLGKQLQLAAHQRFIVGRQHIGAGRQLPGDQGVQRLQVEPVVGGGIFPVDNLHHRLMPQVAEQHESLCRFPSQHLGHVQTGRHHQGGDFCKGCAVFLVRWCIHDDAAAMGLIHPQVAAKAGVSGGQTERRWYQLMRWRHRSKPAVEGGLPIRAGPRDDGFAAGVDHGGWVGMQAHG